MMNFKSVMLCLLGVCFGFSLLAQVKMVDFKKINRAMSQKFHQDYPRLSSLQGYDETHADKIWHDFWHEFTTFLKSKNFDFGKTQRVFVHLHFSAKGDLEVFGYQFAGGKKEKKDAFVAYLSEFLANYDFDLKTQSPASQCGEIHVLAHSEIEEGK